MTCKGKGARKFAPVTDILSKTLIVDTFLRAAAR